MTIEFGVSLLGELLSFLAVAALFAVAALLRGVSFPSILLISRWVRPRSVVSADAVRALPMYRIWVQNLDGAEMLDTRVTLRAPAGRIRAVRVNGGAGRWAPEVHAPSKATEQLGAEVTPHDWVVSCSSGMRPHATWRIEVNVEDGTTEIHAVMLRETIRFGTADSQQRIGPWVSAHSLALLVALGVSVATVAWNFVGASASSLPLYAASILLVVAWAVVLFLIVRPVQAGVMTGWAGAGTGPTAPPANRSAGDTPSSS